MTDDTRRPPAFAPAIPPTSAVGGRRHPIEVDLAGDFYEGAIVVRADGYVDLLGDLAPAGDLLAGLERDRDEDGRAVGDDAVDGDVDPEDVSVALRVRRWRFGRLKNWAPPSALAQVVRDDLDRLAGRLDAGARCLLVLEAYLDDPTPDRAAALVEAVRRVPEQVDDTLAGFDQELRAFAGRQSNEFDVDRLRTRLPQRAVLRARIDHEQAATAGDPALRNGHLVPVGYGGRRYASVTHAYWALSTRDVGIRAAVEAAATAPEAEALAHRAPRTQRWDQVRSALLTDLIRAKYAEHPALAEALLATGDRPLAAGGPAMGLLAHRAQLDGGRARADVLLELVRAELAFDASPVFR
ncbi:hypothetical protein ACF9IK_36245 [Kitasatospora hibisci]|uniref:hypothetical protein n=1 Tax=Kitasatospora hibisci TaxID=3369522 RepID=UPI003754B04F